MAEVETKSRVTILNQQLLYRGTRNLFKKKVKFEKMLLQVNVCIKLLINLWEVSVYSMEIVLFQLETKSVLNAQLDLQSIEFLCFFVSQLTGLEDEHFRRLIDVEKHVKLIDEVLELVCRDFEKLKQVYKKKFRITMHEYFVILVWTNTRSL